MTDEEYLSAAKKALKRYQETYKSSGYRSDESGKDAINNHTGGYLLGEFGYPIILYCGPYTVDLDATVISKNIEATT